MKKFTLSMPVRYIINTVVLIVLLVVGNQIVGSGILGRAQTSIIIQVGFFIILAVSLNMVTGYLGVRKLR